MTRAFNTMHRQRSGTTNALPVAQCSTHQRSTRCRMHYHFTPKARTAQEAINCNHHMTAHNSALKLTQRYSFLIITSRFEETFNKQLKSARDVHYLISAPNMQRVKHRYMEYGEERCTTERVTTLHSMYHAIDERWRNGLCRTNQSNTRSIRYLRSMQSAGANYFWKVY